MTLYKWGNIGLAIKYILIFPEDAAEKNLNKFLANPIYSIPKLEDSVLNWA